MKFEYKEIYKYPTYAMLNLTDNCNLACIYCFVQQQPHYMSIDVAKDAVNFLINNYNIKKEKGWLRRNEKKTLVFFGGEPMLMFDSIIEPIIHYIEETDNINEFTFHITTNGTLLNEERIKFFKKYKVAILLSMDGDEYTQNYNRPCKNKNCSSFQMIKDNIPCLLEHFPYTTFRSTVHRDTISELYNNFLFAESMGFKNYTCIPDSRSRDWTEEDLANYQIELTKIVNHIMEQYLNNTLPKMAFNNLDRALDNVILRDINIIRNKINSHEDTFEHQRCGLGTTTFSINYLGEIFSCQEQDSRENGEYFYIGDIYNGLIPEKQTKIVLDYLTSEGGCEVPEECETCMLANECSHGCPSAQKDLFDNLGIMPYVGCKNLKILFNLAIIVMKVLTEANNELFKQQINMKINNACKKGCC